MSKSALSADIPEDTYNIETELQDYIVKLCDNYSFELEFDNNVDIKDLLKSVNLRFNDSYDSLSEKLFEYMTNIRDLEGDKIFVFVNLSAYISDCDLQLFIETAVNHRFCLLLLESSDNINIKNINKRIIDNDLCEI